MQESGKSQVDFYVRLCTQLISDDPRQTASSKSTSRDIETFKSRISQEGLSFATKSLPRLGKALDAALESGRFTPVNGFKSANRRNTPAFMQAYFNLVFDEDGSLQEEPDVDAISHLRQVLFFAYKLELPYSLEDKERVISSFKTVEEQLEANDISAGEHFLSDAAIWTSVIFNGFDPLDITPRHGPGAVATGEKLDNKWLFSRWYRALHRVYPFTEYFGLGGEREFTDRLDWYNSLEVHDSGTAKVVLVPKDSRGPRLISCEPLEYQWLQQGLGRKLVAFLEASPLTKGRINFTHQSVNQRHALASSASRKYATLDLKDASDRVSLEVVQRVFRRTPKLLQALEALRTTATRLPNGEVVQLRKYAPMGSALCFPVEAYVFWVVMVAAVALDKRVPFENAGRRIYVYGDDIIVPVEWVHVCIKALESIGLVVNRDKSFIKGFFRESCGVDAYNGINVTPLRIRKPWTGRSGDGTSYAAYVSLANRLEAKGYVRASHTIWEEIRRTYGLVPKGLPNSPFPCRWVTNYLEAVLFNKTHFKWRVNKEFQRVEFKVIRLAVRRRKSRLDDWPRLLRDIISPPVGDPSSVVLSRSTRTKRDWAAV